MSQATFNRMKEIVQLLGSKAETVRGVVRFVRDNRKDVARQIRVGLWQSQPLSVHDWARAVHVRKANPEAKRAAADKAFRRRYLAGLRRQEKRWLRVKPGLSGLLDQINGANQRTAHLKEIAKLRSIVTGKESQPAKLPDIESLGGVLIPLGNWREVVKVAKVSGVIMRGKDATMQETFRRSYGIHEAAYTEWDKKGRPRGVRAVHDNFIRSCGVVVDEGRTLEFVIHDTKGRITLPNEYVWDVDGNGLRAVCVDSRRDDYHIDAVDLLGDHPAEMIVARLIANRTRRERFAAEHAVELAEVAGVFVCLADSLRAGNCRAGTMEFAKRHGLQSNRHYGAAELLTIANGEASRVRLAVTAARLRHEKELARGWCEIADHRA